MPRIGLLLTIFLRIGVNIDMHASPRMQRVASVNFCSTGRCYLVRRCISAVRYYLCRVRAAFHIRAVAECIVRNDQRELGTRLGTNTRTTRHRTAGAHIARR